MNYEELISYLSFSGDSIKIKCGNRIDTEKGLSYYKSIEGKHYYNNAWYEKEIWNRMY